MPDELLKPADLADRLKVTPATVAKWRQAGVIPAIRINATTYRFDYPAVVEALRKRADGSAAHVEGDR